MRDAASEGVADEEHRHLGRPQAERERGHVAPREGVDVRAATGLAVALEARCARARTTRHIAESWGG